eukprot:g710.t1
MSLPLVGVTGGLEGGSSTGFSLPRQELTTLGVDRALALRKVTTLLQGARRADVQGDHPDTHAELYSEAGGSHPGWWTVRLAGRAGREGPIRGYASHLDSCEETTKGLRKDEQMCLGRRRNLQDLVALEVRLVLAWLFGLSAAAPLTVGEETPQESKPKFKPNFVKFVISTSSSKPYEHFLGNARGKAMVEKWKAAIRLYSENSVYAQMNQALRHDDMTGLKEYGSLINLTMQPFGLSAMKTHSVLKPFVGTVWRGCNLSSSDLQKYEVGEVVLWEAFSSTSTSPSSAFKGNVVFEIHCNKALEVQKGDEHELKDLFNDLIVPAQIHHLSKYPNENEVLYPPYTKFRLVSRTDMLLTTNIVLETMEFPSLSLLAEEGKWEEVKKGLHARQEHSDESSPAWFTQHASTLLPTITNKIVSEGSNSGGLNIITQLQAYGSDEKRTLRTIGVSSVSSACELPVNRTKNGTEHPPPEDVFDDPTWVAPDDPGLPLELYGDHGQERGRPRPKSTRSAGGPPPPGLVEDRPRCRNWMRRRWKSSVARRSGDSERRRASRAATEGWVARRYALELQRTLEQRMASSEFQEMVNEKVEEERRRLEEIMLKEVDETKRKILQEIERKEKEKHEKDHGAISLLAAGTRTDENRGSLSFSREEEAEKELRKQEAEVKEFQKRKELEVQAKLDEERLKDRGDTDEYGRE